MSILYFILWPMLLPLPKDGNLVAGAGVTCHCKQATLGAYKDFRREPLPCQGDFVECPDKVTTCITVTLSQDGNPGVKSTYAQNCGQPGDPEQASCRTHRGPGYTVHQCAFVGDRSNTATDCGPCAKGVKCHCYLPSKPGFFREYNPILSCEGSFVQCTDGVESCAIYTGIKSGKTMIFKNCGIEGFNKKECISRVEDNTPIDLCLTRGDYSNSAPSCSCSGGGGSSHGSRIRAQFLHLVPFPLILGLLVS